MTSVGSAVVFKQAGVVGSMKNGKERVRLYIPQIPRPFCISILGENYGSRETSHNKRRGIWPRPRPE